MMRETTRRGAAGGALALVLALGFPAAVLGQGDSLVGVQVVPRSGAKLRQDDDRYIDAHQGHHIFKVEPHLASKSGFGSPPTACPAARRSRPT